MADSLQDALNKYNEAQDKSINDLKEQLNNNTGINAYGQALGQAKQAAASSAQNAANNAATQAIAAGQMAGMSKAQAAMNAANVAAESYATQYGNSVLSQQNQIAGYQDSAANAAKTIYQAQLEQAQTQFQTALAEYQRKQQQKAQTKQMIYNLIGSAASAFGGPIGAAVGKGFNAMAAGNGATGSSYMANAYNKTSIQNQFKSDASLKNKSKLDDFMDKLDAYAFKYNEEGKAKGADDDEHIGVMAQDVAKSDVGKSIVSVDENGDLNLDRQKLAEATAACLALIKERMDEIDKEE